MEKALSDLKLMIDLLHPLSLEEWNSFAAIWKPFSAGKKVLLTSEGEKERYLYFVIDGVQRVFYRDSENREATLVFTYTPSFGGVLDSMLLGTASKYNYETLSKSEFLRANYAEVRELMHQYNNIRTLIFNGTSHALAGLLERMSELQCYSSEDKFKKLLGRSPHILNQVPQRYLANYLGIDPTNFSKFINKIVI